MTATGQHAGPQSPEPIAGETRSEAPAPPAAPTQPLPANATTGTDPARTCGAFSILDLCEQAHRDVTRKALCLRDEDLKTAELLAHLETCPECARWYGNAHRAYERLSGDLAPLVLEPLVPYQAKPRTSREIVCAAEGRGFRLQRLKKSDPGGQGLDALELFLEWTQEARGRGQKGKRRWWVTLKLFSRDNNAEFGYDRAVLQRYDGYGVRLQRWVPERSEPEQVVTRLGFDAQQNLVSIPRSLDSVGPSEEETISLALLDRVEETVGD
jgi:hypothetical protein